MLQISKPCAIHTSCTLFALLTFTTAYALAPADEYSSVLAGWSQAYRVEVLSERQRSRLHSQRIGARTLRRAASGTRNAQLVELTGRGLVTCCAHVRGRRNAHISQCRCFTAQICTVQCAHCQCSGGTRIAHAANGMSVQPNKDNTGMPVEPMGCDGVAVTDTFGRIPMSKLTMCCPRHHPRHSCHCRDCSAC